MMKKLIAALFALLVGAPAYGQPVQQSGTVTAKHLPYWVAPGVIGDAGTSASSPISSIGITNNNGCALGINSAAITSGAWNQLCFGVSTTGAATITLQNFGTASPQVLDFIINGTTFPFPGALASITVNSTPVLGGTNGDCLNITGGIVSQVPCSILSAGTTGTGAVVLNNSPLLAGTIGGNLTFSGNETFTGNGTFGSSVIVNGISTPASAVGNTVLLGTVSAPVLTNTGQSYLFNTSIGGATLQGDGSSADVSLVNKSGNTALQVLTGTTTVSLPGGLTLSGLSSGTCASGIGINASNQAITVSCPGAASSIQVGTTTVLSGTTNQILYNNGGTLGNETIASILTAGTGIAVTGTTNATIALGGTATTHTLPVWEGSGQNFGNVATGTLGQFLSAQGSSTDPSMSSGPWTLLATLTASGSGTLSDTTHITSSYADYKLVFSNLVAATTGSSCELQVHSGGAFQATGYIENAFTQSANTVVGITNVTTFFPLCNLTSQTTNAPGMSGEVIIFNPSSSAVHPITGFIQYNGSGVTFPWTISGYWNSAAVIDGFEFTYSAGNISTGTIKIYGRL